MLNWWLFLCAVSALNIAAWCFSASLANRRLALLLPDVQVFTRLQLMLSAGYVLGCAYRSALPVYDIPRLCLFDTWLSSAAVGRSVATVAELCFAAQWALLLRGVAQAAGSLTAVAASRLVVPLIAVAEICSWHAVLTTSNLGHVIEESIWGLTAAMLVASLLYLLPRCAPRARSFLVLCCVGGVAYVIYMFGVDVPMYWGRWLDDEAHGRQYLSVAQGLVDASGRWVVSHSWDEWKSEVAWMSLYFSVAVWLSIGLVHAALMSRSWRRPSQECLAQA